METFERELRKKFPESAKKAANGSRKEAIYMMCKACVGGSAQEARKCTSTDCFLWVYRPGAK